MRKLTILAAALAMALAMALPAVARPAGAGDGGKPAGIECQQAGIATLKSLDLLPAVAKGGIEVDGIGVLPFQTVLKLHREMPSLFQTGGVSVIIPGVADPVPATWCNGI